MQKTGLYHLIAISGAHIGIISLLIFGLLRFARVPLRLSYGVLVILLLLYAVLVEGRASVLRAVIMSIAFLVGKLFWKDAHLLNTIGLSAFAILSVNPFQLFDMGFQLTFAATLAILVFMPKIMALVPKLPLKIGETFAMSVAAQAGVMPLIALSFNRIIFSGLLLNFIGIPLVGLIMAAGYLYLPLALLSRTLSGPIAAGLTFLIKAFMASTHLLDRFAFLSYRIPTPPVLVIAGYFLGLLLLGGPARSRKIRIAEAAGFGLFFAALILYPFPSGSRDLKITFIDVGQGDSILLQFPGRRTMLVDGGGLPVGTFDVGESVVSPFLWSKGLKSIDTLVLTHGHPDHLNGLPAVAANFRIGHYWEAFSPPAESKYAALGAALGTGIAPQRIFRGFSVREGDVRIEALSPRETEPLPVTTDNDRSLVLRITYGSTAFLLAADIGINAEDDILAGGSDVRSQVLKSPHHGSSTSSSESFLAAVAAKFIVISAGAGNRAGLPHPAILDRYRKTGARILRTDLDGAIEFSSDGTAVSVRTAVPRIADGTDDGIR
jgi:competence protein ComEC